MTTLIIITSIYILSIFLNRWLNKIALLFGIIIHYPYNICNWFTGKYWKR